MPTRSSSADPLMKIRDEIEVALAMLAEDDMEARDVFASRIQKNDRVRRTFQRLHRAAGLGEPPAYRAHAAVVREVEVA